MGNSALLEEVQCQEQPEAFLMDTLGKVEYVQDHMRRIRIPQVSFSPDARGPSLQSYPKLAAIL